MESAYEIKALKDLVVAEVKKDGLDVLEAATKKIAKSTYVGIKTWLKESAKVSGYKIDDYLAPFIDNLDAMVLPEIDKISFQSKPQQTAQP